VRAVPLPQAPLHSGFDAASTADDVMGGVDLSGTVAIVTGGASGIGVETVRALRAAGATCIVPARDVQRARAALATIDGVEIEPMDLMVPSTIDAFAARFEQSARPLHLLVCSAGIGGAPLERDERGYESHLATNHLGHFQLVDRLRPALRREGARVVVVSSWAHRASGVVFDDVNYERRPYDPVTAYGQSKTANVLFALALDTRAAAEGVRAFSLHPGAIVDTNFKRHTPEGLLEAVGMVDGAGNAVVDPARGWKSVAQGAATSVWCATSSLLDGLGGVYAQDCDLAPLLDHTDPDVVAAANEFGRAAPGVMGYALDPDRAERLWELSERLLATGA
jgi:NAD(P)-dependent dehydrogenase (short-subunit alcohol dehydrogenase family)